MKLCTKGQFHQIRDLYCGFGGTIDGSSCISTEMGNCTKDSYFGNCKSYAKEKSCTYSILQNIDTNIREKSYYWVRDN